MGRRSPREPLATQTKGRRTVRRPLLIRPPIRYEAGLEAVNVMGPQVTTVPKLGFAVPT